MVLEETLESPLDWKEIKPVNTKGNQPCIFIGSTDVKAQVLTLWPPDVKSRLIGKNPDAGKDWGSEEKGTTEDEMVGWHYRLNRHEFEQTLGDGEGQGSLACCSPWDHKELNMTEQLNWTDGIISFLLFYSTIKILQLTKFIFLSIKIEYLHSCHPTYIPN